MQLMMQTLVSLNAFENCLDIVSLNAMKRDCGSIFILNMNQACFPQTIRYLAIYFFRVNNKNRN